MPFTDIAAVPAPLPPGTGLSFSLRVGANGRSTVRITIRADQQVKYFGGPIAGKKFSAQAGRGVDEGKLRLVMNDDGDLEAKPTIKGSASIYMASWDLLPKSKRPAASCTVFEAPTESLLILTLPSFCKPSGVGGKMAEAFPGPARAGAAAPNPGVSSLAAQGRAKSRGV